MSRFVAIAAIVSCVWAGEALSQTESATPGLEETLSLFRAGKWSPSGGVVVVRDLLKGGHGHAARWWHEWIVAEAEKRGFTSRDLTAVEKAWRRRPSKGRDKRHRPFLVQAVKSLERRVANNEVAAARQVLVAVELAVDLYPDKALQRRIDAAHKKLDTQPLAMARTANATNADKAKQFRDDAVATWCAVLDGMLTEYETHGCLVGAREIRAQLEKHEHLGVLSTSRQDRLAAAEFRLEPKHELVLRFAIGGAAVITRNGVTIRPRGIDGELSAADGAAWAFDVIAGDRLRIEFERYAGYGGSGDLFIIAGGATLDGKVVSRNAWSRDLAGAMTDRHSKTTSLVVAKVMSVREVPTTLNSEIIARIASAGGAIAVPMDEGGPAYRPYDEEFTTAAKAMGKAGGWSWMCGFGGPFRVRFTVP